jgi:uncharacterized protein (TIGR02118 family)
MIRLAVIYPNKEGARFDHDYYADNHKKLVSDRLGPMGLTKVEIDKGIAGMAPGSPPPYVAIMYMTFGSIEELQKAMAAHNDELSADIQNYTDIEPQVLISEIVT